MRYRSKQVQAAIALIFLIASAILCSPLGVLANSTGAIHTLAATSTAATCPTPGNNACITSINSTPTVGITLNGTDQNLSFTMLYILNNSVSGNWHVTLALTQFTTTSVPHRTLPTATTITAVSVVSSCGGNTCPGNTISYPLSVTAGNAPVTFFNNTTGGNHGVGSFTIQTTMSISVPGNSYAGTYTSTFTIAFVSGSA